MTDRAYENAIRRRETLRRELVEIERFIDMWHLLSGVPKAQSGGEMPRGTQDEDIAASGSPSRASAGEVSPDSPLAAGLHPHPISRADLAIMARDVTLDHGRPMTRGQLVAALEARGVAVGGIDKQRNMGTLMWRLRDKFVNIAGRGYWPADVSCPSVGYVAPNGMKESDTEASMLHDITT